MKKWLLITWLLLIIYTIYFLIFNQPSSSIFNDLFSSTINPLVFAVFNMLGIIPFMMILYVIIFRIPVNIYQKLGLGLSFMSGAFALYPTSAFMKDSTEKKHQRWTKLASLFSGFSILLLAIYGLSYGSLENYLESFRNDAFVHIMTIDFFFLYIHSILLSKKSSKFWYISIIPFVGFSYILYE